jgi:signal transduction histidine kinase
MELQWETRADNLAPYFRRFIPQKVVFIPNPWPLAGDRLSSQGIVIGWQPGKPPKLKVTITLQPALRQLSIMAMGLGLWAALVLLFATQFVLVGSFSWPAAFVQAIFFWGLWVLFMPAVVAFSVRFPFERGRISANLTLHLLACVLVVMISQFAFRNLIPAPFPPPGEGPRNADGSTPVARPEIHPPNGFLSLRAAVDILVYWSLFGVCQGLSDYRRSQQRERRAAELEARLTRAKLQALRMQINPHFLFNTLNAISTLVYVDPKAADEMIGDLSELLRRCFDDVEEQEISLGRELQFIGAYINIEKKRFGDRLQMEQDVPKDLLDALIPALILQPLVENAIRHGIEPRRAPGLISIQAKRVGDNLCLIVRDNGVGPVENGDRQKRRGIGLANTQARLRELYGANQKFSFSKGEPRGCTVEMQMPYHTQPSPIPGAIPATPE